MRTRTKKTETHEYQFVSELKCDLCGRTKRTTREDDWASGQFEDLETEIRLKEGTSYPEGGSGIETTIDICPECFKTKLIPWVESQGGKPETRAYDF